jgi:hypothetical protein
MRVTDLDTEIVVRADVCEPGVLGVPTVAFAGTEEWRA